MGITRRDLLWFSAGLGGSALGARLVAPLLAARAKGPASRSGRQTGGAYSGMADPPDDLGPLALDDLTTPPPVRREVDLTVTEQPVAVGRGEAMAAWTFNGRIPGPIIRATEGERIRIRLANRGSRPHNLHFHGTHALASDGWEPLPPGETAVRTFEAGPAGLHPYHCDMTPAPDHIGRGLYGAMIVDPPGGLPPAREVVLVLGGFDTDGDGRSDLFGWNGVAGYYHKYPVKVRAGERVRVYLLNMVPDEPVVSFHLHARQFDVYRSSPGRTLDERTDVVTLSQAERVILEFRLPERGRYMFHPHQARLAERGAMGWFAAV